MSEKESYELAADRSDLPAELVQIAGGQPDLNQAYEALMTGLRVAGRHEPLRTLLVTSSLPGEGKTTTAVGLALAMARLGARVLLVDADLRRPSLHRILGVANQVGVASLGAGGRTTSPASGRPMGRSQTEARAPEGVLRDAVQDVAIPARSGSEAYGLSVVTSGPIGGEPHRALQSGALVEAIGKLAREFDYVLIDSPPILSVGDALMLAGAVDGVILCLRTGEVTESEARTSKEALEEAGARIVGVVMNHFEEGVHGPGSHPYHAYYASSRDSG